MKLALTMLGVAASALAASALAAPATCPPGGMEWLGLIEGSYYTNAACTEPKGGLPKSGYVQVAWESGLAGIKEGESCLSVAPSELGPYVTEFVINKAIPGNTTHLNMSYSLGCAPACQSCTQPFRSVIVPVENAPYVKAAGGSFRSRCVESDASLVGAAKPGTRVWQGSVVSHTTAGKINAVVACAYPP